MSQRPAFPRPAVAPQVHGLLPLAGTWYTVQIVPDAAGQFRLKVWQTSNPAATTNERLETHSDWAGLPWTLRAQAHTGTLDVDEGREITYASNWGRRTGMMDGSGATAWTYDLHGQMTRERKAITGSGSFRTEWGYTATGAVAWMKYPADNAGYPGEKVLFDYYRQGSLNSLFSETANYYYVQQVVYDPAGRLDYRNLGAGDLASNPVLVNDYGYYGWAEQVGGVGQGGRLRSLKSGTPASMQANNPSLQNLEYQYDQAGNIDWVKDYRAGTLANPQLQDFSYDTLNRLDTAVTSGGDANGAYNENYDYNTNGNLWKKGTSGQETTLAYAASVTCTAGTRTLAHAASSAGNSAYTYDCNGNMRTRTVNGKLYTLTYDAENRLVGVSDSSTATYTYDGDGNRVKSEETSANFAAGAPVSVSSPVSGKELVFTDSKLDTDYAQTTSTGLQYAQVDLGAVYSIIQLKVFHYAPTSRTYHNTKTQVSVDGTTWTTIYDSAVSGEYAESGSGKTHPFAAQNVRYIRDYLNGSTVDANNRWVEIEAWGSATTTYVGGHLEWSGSTATMKKYYTAGGQVVAMRTGVGTGTTGLTWLVGDHLNSNSASANGATGDKESEVRYKPWGEKRYQTANMLPTDRRYTGQRQEASLGGSDGLYFYNARWYDPSLGRFVSPDSIIPPQQGTQAWDRYAYVNNNPVLYNDPSGHCILCIAVAVIVGIGVGVLVHVGINRWSIMR